ncbi:DUF1534 domain-containing protein [Pseudomonas syringae]|nr:DUF1534 domain-containing protein [Pseudomonas syringae]MCF5483194.1 DUF1534 domain-containing protein [Pseudomonas syringae]MCF5487146.1 DUF1534 domain-containing protein [Pseudomonas syringae]MCF5491273.1 DUF1534 domain-containing protein [Pseudomonas syringae]MCF5496581.1 DUF1534 domain-containing protein [Pseudomonas syringae]
MPCVTLRVTNLRRAAHSGLDAERPERHAHAEHGHNRCSFGRLSFLTLQRGNALRDAPRHKSAPRWHIQERTQSVQNCVPTRSMGTIGILSDAYRSSRSGVGMPCVTLRVTGLRRAAYSRADLQLDPGGFQFGVFIKRMQ